MKKIEALKNNKTGEIWKDTVTWTESMLDARLSDGYSKVTCLLIEESELKEIMEDVNKYLQYYAQTPEHQFDNLENNQELNELNNLIDKVQRLLNSYGR